MRCKACDKQYTSLDWTINGHTKDWDDLCFKCRDLYVSSEELKEDSEDGQDDIEDVSEPSDERGHHPWSDDEV